MKYFERNEYKCGWDFKVDKYTRNGFYLRSDAIANKKDASIFLNNLNKVEDIILFSDTEICYDDDEDDIVADRSIIFDRSTCYTGEVRIDDSDTIYLIIYTLLDMFNKLDGNIYNVLDTCLEELADGYFLSGILRKMKKELDSDFISLIINYYRICDWNIDVDLLQILKEKASPEDRLKLELLYGGI